MREKERMILERERENDGRNKKIYFRKNLHSKEEREREKEKRMK